MKNYFRIPIQITFEGTIVMEGDTYDIAKKAAISVITGTLNVKVMQDKTPLEIVDYDIPSGNAKVTSEIISKNTLKD